MSLVFLCVAGIGFTQNSSSNILNGEEDYFSLFQISESESRFDFYQGVSLYNAGYVSESLVAFQRALSLRDYPIYQYMYARVSLAYGLKNQSTFIYTTLLNNGYLQSFIRTKLEFLRLKNRVNIRNYSLNQIVRVSSMSLDRLGYRLPMTINTLPDGNLVVVFLQSNDVVVISPTGKILFELATDLSVINRPTDVLFTTDEKFLVTSFRDDLIYSFNKKGGGKQVFFDFVRNKTEVPINITNYFSGPQYLTEGDSGNIYVSVYGSSRIFKFTKDGKYLFDFGRETNNFRGLIEPTGIVFIDNQIIIADYVRDLDQIYSKLYYFDLSGNFLKEKNISDERISTIRSIEDNSLLIATDTHILRYDLKTENIIEDFTQNEFSSITTAVFDVNSVLWIVDQGRDKIETYSYLESQYTGIDAHVVSVDTSQFPIIEAEVSVESVFGKQIIGLDKSNFIFFEDNQSIENIEVIPTKEYVELEENIIVIPSVRTFSQKIDINAKGRILESVRNIVSQGQEISLTTKKHIRFWLLETQKVPIFQVENTFYEKKITDKLTDYTPPLENERYLIQTFRFAINTLLPLGGKNTIVFTGKLPQYQTEGEQILWAQIEEILAFYNIGLVYIGDELNQEAPDYFERMLRNNDIVSLKTNYLDGKILDEISNFRNSGSYIIRYRSNIPRDFNEKFVLVDIETNFNSASGKDVLGYVIPQWDDE